MLSVVKIIMEIKGAVMSFTWFPDCGLFYSVSFCILVSK